MAKTVDLNKKTLEQEKNDFIMICKVFQAVCVVFAATAAVLVAILIVPLVVLKADVLEMVVVIANAVPMLLGFVTACNFGRSIFGKLKNGDTPFRWDIADKVKGAALSLCGTCFVGIIVQAISYAVSEHFSGIGQYFTFASWGCGIMGAVLCVVAYVMNYGCKLQQESDETL